MYTHFEFEKSFKFQTIHIRDFLRKVGFIGPKTELLLKHVNAYLVKKLDLKDKLAKKKSDVVDTLERLFFKAHTAHIRKYLVSKGFLKAGQELLVKHVNAFLVKKLNLKKKPLSRKAQIATVWGSIL